MFTRNSQAVLLLFCLAFIFGTLNSNGQLAEHEVPALKQQAMEHFQSGAYASAKSDFSSLIKQFPQDPMYRYYLGICQVELSQDLDQAAELLTFASKRGVPEDVYYYLGEAYRKKYDFDQAKKYFLQFDKEASRSQAREKNSKLLIRSVQSAKLLTSMYNPFQVINVTFVNLHDPEEYEQVKMKGGNLVQKPAEFVSPGEDMTDLNALMFMPRVAERGKKVYFSGLEKNQKGGFQIMQARKGNTGKWTDIKAVDILNTEGDEILPYYDPVGKDIYYASNGKEGLGGFDLYQSHYDEERDEWSTPISLGFPVNSAFDDYLVLPGSDLGMVIIFSGRQASDSATAVYRVHLSEPKEALTTASPEELRRIANLDNIASRVLADYQALQDPSSPDKAPELASPAADPSPKAGESTSAKETPGSKRENKTDAKYQSLIAQALRHQATSDSLTELSAAARMKVRDSDDPNDRWLYQKQIMVWEKKAKTERELADNYFTAVGGYSKEKEVPDVLEKDTVINEITVYRYALDASAENAGAGDGTTEAKDPLQKNETKEFPPGKEEGLPKKTTELQAKPANNPLPKGPEPVNVGKVVNDFDILAGSPYHADAPIPMDQAVPGGTFYRIQLGVYSKEAAPDAFGGIRPVTGEILKDRNLFKYYAGAFSRYSDAQKVLPKIRQAGYTDAFIVSWYQGKKMSVEKVQKLEK